MLLRNTLILLEILENTSEYKWPTPNHILNLVFTFTSNFDILFFSLQQLIHGENQSPLDRCEKNISSSAESQSKSLPPDSQLRQSCFSF